MPPPDTGAWLPLSEQLITESVPPSFEYRRQIRPLENHW
jgi:hypothetical protein